MHVAVLVFVSTLAERMRVSASERDSRQKCELFDFFAFKRACAHHGKWNAVLRERSERANWCKNPFIRLTFKT